MTVRSKLHNILSFNQLFKSGSLNEWEHYKLRRLSILYNQWETQCALYLKEQLIVAEVIYKTCAVFINHSQLIATKKQNNRQFLFRTAIQYYTSPLNWHFKRLYITWCKTCHFCQAKERGKGKPMWLIMLCFSTRLHDMKFNKLLNDNCSFSFLQRRRSWARNTNIIFRHLGTKTGHAVASHENKTSSKTSLSLIQVTWCSSLSSEHLSLVSAGAMGKDCW